MDEKISFIPLGGVSDVTRNMYLYGYKDEILIVDCGLGFADETMLGVDLLLPDITYLKNLIKTGGKKIVGMALTHGHEDHIGSLPFVLPELPQFPIFASPLTAALANEKLKEFEVQNRVKTVEFGGGEINVGSFRLSFIRITHSVPDTSNIFVRTPVGNFYHGSDFKFDETPYDGKTTDFAKIEEVSKEGILCLFSDSLRAEKKGHTPSEIKLTEAFDNAMGQTKGKFIVTTYSSNLSRVNQVVDVAKKYQRKVCFIGRSMIKAKEIGQNLGYVKIENGMEISIEQIKNFKDFELCLIVAGSQAQENSALTRIINDDFREVKIKNTDTIVFSADPIPGNETSIYALVDTISKKGAEVIYSEVSDGFHVSGHAAEDDLIKMIHLTSPKKVLPIGGTYRQMVAYKNLAKKAGIAENNIIIIENGQEVIFSKDSSVLGKKIKLEKVYMDGISGEEVESFVLRDRQKLAKDGLIVIIAEIDSSNGQVVDKPDIIARGMNVAETRDLNRNLVQELKRGLGRKGQKITDWIYVRKLIGEISERYIYRKLRKRPLVLPIVIEV